MGHHEEKVNRIAQQLKSRQTTGPVTLKKKTVSHQVPKPGDKKYTDDKLDISDLDDILLIDPERQICVAEPGVTFARIVDATLPYGLIPLTVPELETITLGGAVAGCSIESMSFKYGGFHDSCLEYEIVTGEGNILICTPDNENQLIFQMLHGTFGTLGIITRLTFRLIPAKPYVRVVYTSFDTLDDYLTAIAQHRQKQDLDFMDGIIHSPERYVLSAGYFVDQAPYTHRYDWTRIYYRSTAQRKEDYLKIRDYFFRYNKGVTNVYPRFWPLRLLFGRWVNANRVLGIARTFRRVIPAAWIPVTVDTFIPYSKMASFMAWYTDHVSHFPLWCVPFGIVRRYEWLADTYTDQLTDDLFLDIALYGLRTDHADDVYRMIEEKLTEIGAVKTLISNNFYDEDTFWTLWNKRNYDLVKQRTDPGNVFRDLYDKTCRAARGINR